MVPGDLFARTAARFTPTWTRCILTVSCFGRRISSQGASHPASETEVCDDRLRSVPSGRVRAETLMVISLPRVILLRLLCTLLALAAALLISSIHSAAEPSSSAVSLSNVENQFTPENWSALSREARIFTAVEPTPSRTKKLEDSKKAKEKSTRPPHVEIINRSGSKELAAIFPFDDACSWTWTARSPPKVLT
jgi:hypothetical protein